MSEVITKLKVKQLDGNFGQEIPVGAKAQNVYFDRKLSTETNNILGRVSASLSLDALTKNLQDKLVTFQGKKTSNSAISDNIWTSPLSSNKILATDGNGKIIASNVATTNLSAIDTIKDKLDKNLGSEKANKVLITNGSSQVTTSTNVTVNDLNKIVGIGGLSDTLLQTLNKKQPEMGSNSALANSNVWTKKLTTNKVLISDTNGNLATSTITTDQLNSLSNLNTLLGQKADTTTTNNALNNTITVDQTTGTEVKLNFNTLGGASVSKSIGAVSASQNGIMTKAQYNDLKSLSDNLKNYNVVNNSTTTTAAQSILDAYQGYLHFQNGFFKRGVISQATTITNDQYLPTLAPGAYEIALDTSNTDQQIAQVVPVRIPEKFGTLLVTWVGDVTAAESRAIGANNTYKAFIFISTNGKMYIRHWGLNNNTWHDPYQAGWIQINPSLYNALDGQNVTNRPLTAHQGYVLNNKINNIGSGGGDNNYSLKQSTVSSFSVSEVSSNMYYKLIGGIPSGETVRQKITLPQGTWLVYCNFKNAGTKTIQVDLTKNKHDNPGYNGRAYSKTTDPNNPNVGWKALMTMTVPAATDNIAGRTQMMVPITITANNVTNTENELAVYAHFNSTGSSGTLTIGLYAIRLS